MSKTYLFFLAVIFILPARSSFGASDVNDCKVSNYQELVLCAENQSSEIKISESQLKAAEKLEAVASQWINPELDADTVSKGTERSETNASLFFTLRLGGKRSAQISEAQSELERARAVRDLSVYGSRLEIMLSLYRLSHLKSEIDLEEESVETFSKIVKQYQKRPALSPEQDVSLSVFKMSLADHQLKLTKLKSDEEKLFQALKSITGLSRVIISKNLPPPKQNWPVIDSSSETQETPQVRAAIAELKVAQNQKERAEAESWPDIKVGPTMKTVKENGQTTTFAGFGLSMPIPVFTINGAGRAYGAQKQLQAELELEQAKRKSFSVREELVSRYNQTTQSLKSSVSLGIVNEKHEQIERQFFKGLVPSSLVIEAHRQLFELEEQKNSSELEALESLGRILILDNKFNEVIL